MSSNHDRGGSSRGGGSSYRERDHGRDRSRSPRRDNERARPRYDDPPPRGSRDDRHDSSSRSHDPRSGPRSNGQHDDRPPREPPAGPRDTPAAPRGPRGFVPGREEPPHQRQPYGGGGGGGGSPAGPGQGYGGHQNNQQQGYGRGGGQGGGGGGGNYERPLDRRAIEEGRRQREAERAEQRTRELIEKRDREEAELAQRNGGDVKGKISQAATKKLPRSYTSTTDPDRKPTTTELEGGSPYQRGGEGSDDEEDEGEGMEEDDPEAEAMAQMLGFGGFGTSKNQKRKGADGAASVNKQRTWRQYMNRRGGFNRPLDALKK